MERPLSPEYLNYAAKDARLIHILFDSFTAAGWTKLLSLEESMRYVTFHKHSQPKGEDQYKNHSLLPLGILNPLFRKCIGCERQLPFESFATTDSGGQCYVCTAITRRNEAPVRSKGKEGKSSDGEFQIIHRVAMSY